MSSKPDDELTRTEDAASGSTSEKHTVIGAYRLLRHIGEGGMGKVWLAEQQHPLRRQVALKLIKPDMDSRQVVARFEAERQALALMDHPAIATVFDGGTTPGGRPYFAMEVREGRAHHDLLGSPAPLNRGSGARQLAERGDSVTVREKRIDGSEGTRVHS